MDKKYISGNQYLSDSFSLCNYEINLNNTNNRLNYLFNLFPYSNSIFKPNVIFENLTINNYKYDIYYSFSYLYPDNKYNVYDAKGDYEELIFSSSEEDYDTYNSMNYILYYYYNHDDNAKYELYNKITKISYLFYNNYNYPFKIFYDNGYYVEISFNQNNTINKITCLNEEIFFSYNSSNVEILLTKNINNQTINCAKTSIQIVNNDVSISYYVYEYDYDEENYMDNIIKEINLIKSSNYLKILDNINNHYVKFYMTDNKITQIDNCNGTYNNNDNIFTTTISYSSNMTTVTYDDKNYKVIYDNNNMKKYIIYDSKYIKYYEYNNDFLLSYESDNINNKSLIEDELSDFDIITYEPGEDDYDDYSFDIEEVYNQTLPPQFNNFITSNDIYHIEGYGELEYTINQYGEAIDSNSIFFLYKIISGYFYAEITYYCGITNHTLKTKLISSPINSDYNPFIMGLKPNYAYDGIKISLFINGEIYINTPKLNKLMGTYYAYNANNLLASIMNSEGTTSYTYQNDRIISIESPKSTINYTRDIKGNITVENIDGYIINRTYDSKNRITSEYDIYNHYTYSYSDEISDGIYSYIIVKNILINNETIWLQTIKKDNIGNIIYNNFYNKEIKSYNYDGINMINFYHNQQGISYSYNGYNQLSQVYDNHNTKYNYTYSNDNIATVNYNINKSLISKTYDNKDRVISKTFNGTHTFEYLTNPKQDKIYYNNVLKYTLNYNNYDQLISDDYNNFTYDVNNSIRQNEINNVIFNYYKNSIGYTPNSSGIYNYFYSDTILGYTKLKTDSYYSNITFHNNPNVSIINSCITSILKYQDKLYPLQNNLLDVNNNGPISFSKQEYKLFYYDKDIDSYATLLYGTRIIYDTNVYNQGIIELEFKLENRNLDQLILELHNNRTIRLFRDSNNNKLKIHSDYTNITYNTNYYVYSNVWYKLKVKITEFSVYVDIKRITDISYNEYSVSNTLNENMTVKIQLGQIDYIYNHMTTFGLVRNLFVSNNITNREYVNISKIDCHLYNNQLLSSKIEQNNAKIIINREILSIDEDINNHNCIESKKLSLSSNNVLKALMQTYDDKNMCYKKKIIINILSQISSIYTYNYDTFNRLTREDIYDTHDILLYYNTYTYDYLNNITSYNEYDNQSAVTKSISFNYNQTYKTVLDSISITDNGITTNYPITYDNQTGLLPISFMGNSYSYEGKRLISYNNYNYEYNVYGRRIRKYTNGNSIDIHYYYDTNNNLLYEDRGSYKLKYLYDAANQIYGFIYDTSDNSNFNLNIYYYVKDELAVIHSIIDINGNIIGKYEYNAYGQIKSIIQNSDTFDIMNINPIRYKSYYYDTESNMYYLNNRYYHPLLARFITPDSYEYIDINNIKTFNLYAYCNNDPINYADPEGTFVFGLLAGIFGFALPAITPVLAAVAPVITPVVPIAVVAATVSDLENLKELSVIDESNDQDNNIRINNSYKIITPWVQYFYSIYVAHINDKSSKVIRGTSFGVQYEWMCHNAAYYGLSLFSPSSTDEIDKAKNADIGARIFNDDHGLLTTCMVASYFEINPIAFIVEIFTW